MATQQSEQLSSLSNLSQNLFQIDVSNLQKFVGTTVEMLMSMSTQIRRLEGNIVSRDMLADAQLQQQKHITESILRQVGNDGLQQKLDDTTAKTAHLMAKMEELRELISQDRWQLDRLSDRVRSLDELFNVMDSRLSSVEQKASVVTMLNKQVGVIHENMDRLDRDFTVLRVNASNTMAPVSSSGQKSVSSSELNAIREDLRKLQGDARLALDSLGMIRDTRKSVMSLYNVLGVDVETAADANGSTANDSALLDAFWASKSAKAVMGAVETALEVHRARLQTEMVATELYTRNQNALAFTLQEIEAKVASKANATEHDHLVRELNRLCVIGERFIDLNSMKSKLLSISEVAGDLESYRVTIAQVQDELKRKVDFRIVDMKADREYLDAKLRRLRTELMTRIDKLGVESVGHVQQLADSLLPALDHKAERMDLKRIEQSVSRMLQSVQESTSVQEGGAARFRCLSCNRQVGPVYTLVGNENVRELENGYNLALGSPLPGMNATGQIQYNASSQSLQHSDAFSPTTPNLPRSLPISANINNKENDQSMSLSDAIDISGLQTPLQTGRTASTSLTASRPTTADYHLSGTTRDKSPPSQLRPIVHHSTGPGASHSSNSIPSGANPHMTTSNSLGKLPAVHSAAAARPATAQSRAAVALIGEDNRIYRGEAAGTGSAITTGPSDFRPSSAASSKKPLSPF
eukprot:ANDGO_01282.mRNA.1 hypothetical protein